MLEKSKSSIPNVTKKEVKNCEAAWPSRGTIPKCLQKLRKTVRNLSYKSHVPWGHSHQTPPKHKFRVLHIFVELPAWQLNLRDFGITGFSDFIPRPVF
jgi:hypothetical protein